MNYVRSLDGLRALAVTLVLLFHYYYGSYWGFGWIGVQLFFVLSGFLITSILLGAKDEPLDLYLRRFYWRRSLRIFPLYFAFVLGIAFIHVIAKFPENFPGIAPYLFTYTYNFEPLVNGYKVDFIFTHFWSLSVEEQFYLFWPFVIFFLNNAALRKFIIFILVACPLVRFGMFQYLSAGNYNAADIGQLIYRFTPGQIDAFAYGALIPVFGLQNRPVNTGKLFVFGWAIFLVAGVINALALLADGVSVNWLSLGYENGDTTNYQHVWTYMVVNFAAVTTILYLLGSRTAITAIFESAPAVLIGRVSYGMYVYHWPLRSFHLRYIDPHIQISAISFAVYFLLVLLISYVSFQLFESRILKLKDYKLRTAS